MNPHIRCHIRRFNMLLTPTKNSMISLFWSIKSANIDENKII